MVSKLTESNNIFLRHMYKQYLPSFEKSMYHHHPERSRFLFNNWIVNRNKALKLVGRVNALRFNLQLNDLEISLYNELKTFFLVNTRLYRYHKTVKKYLPLTELGIKKRAFYPGWFKYKDLLYHSTHNMRYRTFMVNVKDKQLFIPAYIRRVRPLNKEIMYNIGANTFSIDYQLRAYIVKKRRPRSLFAVLYLGFKFYCHIRKRFWKKKRKRLKIRRRKKKSLKYRFKKHVINRVKNRKRIRRRKYRQTMRKRRRLYRKHNRLHLKHLSKEKLRIIYTKKHKKNFKYLFYRALLRKALTLNSKQYLKFNYKKYK